jgi:hypothetical protein
MSDANDESVPIPAARSPLKGKLDLIVALSALATSAVSIWLAISQGDDMERLVQAQSWPFLGFDSSNVHPNPTTGAPEHVMTLVIENLGVGPAKIRTVEVVYEGKAIKGGRDLLRACCDKPDPETEERASTETPFVTSSTAGRVLRAGQRLELFLWRRGAYDAHRWDQLDQARLKLDMQVCYCSVFEECWIVKNDSNDAQRVDSCPAVAVPYVE